MPVRERNFLVCRLLVSALISFRDIYVGDDYRCVSGCSRGSFFVILFFLEIYILTTVAIATNCIHNQNQSCIDRHQVLGKFRAPTIIIIIYLDRGETRYGQIFCSSWFEKLLSLTLEAGAVRARPHAFLSSGRIGKVE